ncbi:MAG: DUF1822 family protein [Cyanobacteriota bacterium]|nr:DUF1822 family protein [Cyanobacteriota bacterium]
MTILTTSLGFTVPLTARIKNSARQKAQKYSEPQIRERIYRNALAIWTVNFYCQCMGIETEFDVSSSSNLAIRVLADIAELPLKNLGKLECRAVLSNEQVVNVPMEAWSDRIGYVAVQFSDSFNEAKLVGFVKTADTEYLPLNQWHSLGEFLKHVQFLNSGQSSSRTQLSQWFDRMFATPWEAVETLFSSQLSSQYSEFGANFRNVGTQVRRGKRLDLARANQEVALLVGLEPAKHPEIDISVHIYPMGNQSYLPRDLCLEVIDETGEAVMQARSRDSKNIRLEFSGEPGEEFSVKVTLGDFSITEAFLI